MKLFFDARYTRTDYHDGISRYSAELGTALAKLTSVTFLISDEGQKKWFPEGSSFVKIHPGTSLKEPLTAFILNAYAPDVVYSPMQTIGTFGRKYTSVLTVHDLIYYRHPSAPKFLPAHVRFGWWLYHQAYWPQRLLLKGGDIITSVSQTSAQDMQKARMTKKPIHTILNAPQKFSKYPVTHKEGVKNLVFMGSFMRYKNAETLVRAMEFLPGHTLHLLSKIRPERKQELESLTPKGGRIIFHNGVTDDEYEQLLANNAALVTASLDEGFGIPVAEAMQMGVPVVASDTPVFHEVGGEGVLYANPASPQDFANAVRTLDSEATRSALIQKAKEHIKQFNWDDSAKALLAALHSYQASKRQ